MSDELVLAEHRGPVLLLTLNRPDRLNAWNDALEERYFALLDDAEASPDVRAVVVTGAGRGFCAGADLADLEQVATVDFSTATLPERKRPRERPLALRKPLIAAINGAAVGLGLVEALYCDLRFCTPNAKLGTAFVRRGLIAEYGIAWLLPRLIGQSRALDLLLSGRIIQGEEALAMGLVDRVVPDVVEAAVERADPEAPRVILDEGRDLFTRQCAAGLAKVQEGVAFGLPAIEPRRRPHPHRSAAIEREREYLIVAE